MPSLAELMSNQPARQVPNLSELMGKYNRPRYADEYTHQSQTIPQNALGSMLQTGFGRLSRGEAMLTGEPMANALERIKSGPVDEVAMDWVSPGASGLAGIFAGKGAKLADIVKGGGKAMSVPAKTEFELAHELAQRNAALPIEQGGLGLPAWNTAMDRAKAMAGLKAPDIPTDISKKYLKEILNSEIVQRAHEVGNMDFHAMPLPDYLNKKTSIPVYSSPSGSNYKIGIVNGEPVYMRSSNHFGHFATNVYREDSAGKALDQIGNDLPWGNYVASRAQNTWNLKGGGKETFDAAHKETVDQLEEGRKSLFAELKAAKPEDQFSIYEKIRNYDQQYPRYVQNIEAGYIPLRNLEGRLPEKVYGGVHPDGGAYEAKLINMGNGVYRSRFAAFDPMQRNSANILAGGLGGAIGLNALLNYRPGDEYQ